MTNKWLVFQRVAFYVDRSIAQHNPILQNQPGESHSTFADNVIDWENKALLLAFEVIQDWMDLDRQSNENYTV